MTVVILGIAALTPAVGSPQRAARVGTAGTGLTLDGRPWWPVGMNAYQLATDWSVNVGCGAQVDPDDYFSRLPARSLTRFNAFESLATNKYTGARDWTSIDRVFAAAERHGQLVIPVLTAMDGSCEDEVFKDHGWYVDGWKTRPHGLEPSFAAWTEAVVARYRNSPALAAWEAVGEPEPAVCTIGPGGACDVDDRYCPPGAAQVLRAFFDESGRLIRGIAPGTPITAGLAGGGQCGAQGDEYEYVGASPWIDILQYHDYHSDGVPLPGDRWNGLARRLEQTRVLGKPLLVAEIGQAAGSCLPLARRVTDVKAKIDGQRAAGTAGALLWSFVPDPRPDECTYDIGPDDPLFDLLAAY